jgi:hypothetical protein
MENPNHTRERAKAPGGQEIHVDRYGSGDRVLVLLHRVPTAPSDFTPLAETMSSKCRQSREGKMAL